MLLAKQRSDLHLFNGCMICVYVFESNLYRVMSMKVVAMPEVYLYNLSLRRAMDAARFFFL